MADSSHASTVEQAFAGGEAGRFVSLAAHPGIARVAGSGDRSTAHQVDEVRCRSSNSSVLPEEIPRISYHQSSCLCSVQPLPSGLKVERIG